MTKALIIGDHLLMAGAERLMYEVACFAKQNQIQVTILIFNNYNVEYYDLIFKEMGIKVVRTSLNGLARLRNPVNLGRAIFWSLTLKYFAKKMFRSVHIIGLYNVEMLNRSVVHDNRYLWHVNNSSQYTHEQYPFSETIFHREEDTIIYINKHQEIELRKQYGNHIRCMSKLFKLFINR